jgi:hypothetical protein
MKGQRILFDNLVTTEKLLRKGRSSKLIARRDEFLMVRYFYHTEVKRLRFDDVLRILSEDEFFIEEATITNRLTSLADEISRRFNQKPTLARLKELSGNFIIDITAKEKERYEKCL